MSKHSTRPIPSLARPLALAAFALTAAAGAYAQKGETVKIAWIDPLSGLMAPVGQNQVKSFQFFAEKFNANNPAGVKFEIIPIDNKLSPAESLNALKSAIDQGVRYVTQGNGSGAALTGEQSVTPCGGCRQALLEASHLAGRDFEIICASGDGMAVERLTLSSLIPHGFGPGNLTDAG